jgi:CRISPR-associated protein Cmx8
LAKAKAKQVVEVDVLKLEYRLAELPSSQHRSGLAGLILIIRWLERQPAFQQKISEGAICQITQIDDYGATLELNQAGLGSLFDEIYDANLEPQPYDKPKTKGKGDEKETVPWLEVKEVQHTDPKTQKTKTKKVYIYEDVIPKGSFLLDPEYDTSSDGKSGIWIKLWRNTVWSILRGVDATRKPFKIRADDLQADDSTEMWKQLLQPDEFTVDLPSTYFLGAQANNAENVAFKDRGRFQFLLHFWLFAAQIYVPAISKLEKDKQTGKYKEKRDFVGYAIAIPDIARLEWFCDELPGILKDRSPKPSGYRPRQAVIDIAVESALDVMRRLQERLAQSSADQSTAPAIFGVDVIHTEKQGNNVRLLSTARLDPEEAMIDQYAQIRDNFWSPLFRRQCLLNLVNHSPWYQGFDALLCKTPHERSLEDSYFKRDVRTKIEIILKEIAQMAEVDNQAVIAEMVFRLVKNYVNRKLKAKHDLEWKKEWSSLKNDELSQQSGYSEYSEKKSKVAKSAFLDVRSRTEKEDFINYFASTLCSVPQNMKSESFTVLAQSLYQDTEQIRTLTLLALSANS